MFLEHHEVILSGITGTYVLKEKCIKDMIVREAYKQTGLHLAWSRGSRA
jgi:hypothetical protein